MKKKSTLRTRSVSGFVFLFLLLLTFFAGQASAGIWKELLEIDSTTGPEKVRQLIQDGEDVNFKNIWGLTPLRVAAERNSNPEVLKVLIEAGADVNDKNGDGSTPLMIAANNNPNPEVLKVLLEAGSDVNAKKEDGSTPLMIAANSVDRKSVV